MTDQPKLRSRHWNSLLRLMVQALGVLFVAIGGWSAWVLNSAKIQHDAVVAIENAGGSVGYGWELRDGPLVPTPKPLWLKWLVDHLGADCFSNVIRVELKGKGSDSGLARVSNLTLIDYLDAGGSSITDSGLVHLKRLTQLRELRLNRTAVTDAGLAHLKGLTRLEKLDLGSTAVADAGLAHLQSLTALRDLELSNTRVTDAGIPFLERLSLLEGLGLWRTEVSEGGIRELKRALSLPHISH
jgi:internalin A